MSTTRAKWYDLNEEFPNENEDVIVTNGEDVWVDNYWYNDGEPEWSIYPEGKPTMFAYMPDPPVQKPDVHGKHCRECKYLSEEYIAFSGIVRECTNAKKKCRNGSARIKRPSTRACLMFEAKEVK